jgi:hypothetical protein
MRGIEGVRSEAIEGAIGSGVTSWGNQQRGGPTACGLPPLVTPQRRRTHYEVEAALGGGVRGKDRLAGEDAEGEARQDA